MRFDTRPADRFLDPLLYGVGFAFLGLHYYGLYLGLKWLIGQG